MSELAAPRPAANLRSAALWSASSQYLNFAMQFATSVIISRFFLAPEEIGLFSVALAAAMMVAILQDFGLARFISGHPNLDRATIGRCSLVAIGASLGVAAILLALAWPASLFYDEPRIGWVLAIIAGSYLLNPLSAVPLALMQRDLDFRGVFAVNSTGMAVNSGVALTLAAMGFSAESLGWAMVAQALVRGLMAQRLRPAPLPRLSDGHGAGEVVSFGSASTLLYISGSIGVRSPDLIVGRILGMTAVGLYSRGSALAAQLHMLVIGAIGGIFYPAFARLRDEGRPLGPQYERVVAAHGAIVWPAMALISVLAEPVILLLYGEAWAGAARLLSWLALAEMGFVMLPLHVDLPILLGRIRTLIWFNLVDTALSLGTLIAGAWWGIEAAAASRLVYVAGWFLLYAGWMHRLVGFSWRKMAAIYLRSAAVTLVTVLPALWAIHGWRSGTTLGFDGLVATGMMCGTAWVAALVLLRHQARCEVEAMASHILAPLLRRIKPARA
jgi:O-antigen/teichoic acid export membrane protein